MIPAIRTLIFATVLCLPSWGNWTTVPGTENHQIQKLLAAGGVLYEATQNAGAFTLAPPAYVPVLSLSLRVDCFVAQGNAVYAGTDSGLYRTRDNGAHWTRLASLGQNEGVNALAAQGDTLYAGVTSGGVAVSWDGGNAWTRGGKDLMLSGTRAIGASGSLVFAEYGGRSAGFTLNRSEDAGKTWTEYWKPDPDGRVTGILFLGDRLFVAASSGLRISPDRGASWSFTSSQAEVAKTRTGSLSAALEFSGGVLFFTHGGANDFGSLDSGATWSRIDNPPWMAESYAAIGGRIYAGTAEGLVYTPLEGGLPVLPGAKKSHRPAARWTVGRGSARFWRGAGKPSVFADGRNAERGTAWARAR